MVLRNFKGVSAETYEFQAFDLLVGRNNSGKSTVLQAMAIWQFCVDEFHRSKRSGKTGTQVVLPNFTAVPVPEFNLLWRHRTDRHYPKNGGTKEQKYILIEIELHWTARQSQALEEKNFTVQLRYNSPQSVYAIPKETWSVFRSLEKEMPRIAYVPPFSGLEPTEEWRDDGPLRRQVGKAQPGSVLRNLLWRVFDKKGRGDWDELVKQVDYWFSVKLKQPKYEKGIDTQIVCEYTELDRDYDIIVAGSGFHQALTLLAFLYGYKPTTILLDEPDAHLHVNLQREILDYFRIKAGDADVQCLIATHAEEFVKGVEARQIVSLLRQTPIRIESSPAILTAMAEVSNMELARLRDSPAPIMLYLEGESDERVLRAWAKPCGAEGVFDHLCVHFMHGGPKTDMKAEADRHFQGVTQIIPNAKRLVLFDYDTSETAFHPTDDNPTLYEWKRKNIQNYLLVPNAWVRAVRSQQGELFAQRLIAEIESFFEGENLRLPPNQTWRAVRASVFQAVDGKRLLFANADSLFHRLQSLGSELTPEAVADHMTGDEIHDDVHGFFAKLRWTIESVLPRP